MKIVLFPTIIKSACLENMCVCLLRASPADGLIYMSQDKGWRDDGKEDTLAWKTFEAPGFKSWSQQLL
jgi:hypothetical protein